MRQRPETANVSHEEMANNLCLGGWKWQTMYYLIASPGSLIPLKHESNVFIHFSKW
jgi:hypothetical protein